jgi:predicted nucleic acid-binding protein
VITAVDTSVLLDVFGADSLHGERSREALRTCLREGSLIACDVVWAETAACFPDGRRAQRALDRLGVRFVALDAEASIAAARAWRAYRRNGGKRSRVIADFLIGGHAAVHADRLLSRDRGFARSHFSGLSLLDPSRD